MAPIVPWYQRPLSVRRRVSLLLGAILIGLLVSWLASQNAAARSFVTSAAGRSIFSLVPCVGCWQLLQHGSRWAPWLGFGAVTAAAASSFWGEPLPLLLVLLAAVGAFIIPPRPHRPVMRVVAVGVSLLAAAWPLLGAAKA
jgi:hypothetical protein